MLLSRANTTYLQIDHRPGSLAHGLTCTARNSGAVSNEEETMGAMAELSAHMKTRILELKKLRDEGRKIIGYTPGGYMPEELVYACGAVPAGLLRGGEHEPVVYAGAYLPRWLDTFCRAQIGYRLLKEEALYQMIDLLVVPITDNNIRAIADSWDFYTDVEVFRFGVPHAKTDSGFKYYLEGIDLFRQKLEDFTGVKISEPKLREAIELCNKERGLLKEISLMRKSPHPPISGRDFINLNHASFLLDKRTMIKVLESLLAELRKRQAPPPTGPRVLLTGSTLAYGDYKMLSLIEETGASVVVEEFAEGMRHYWETVRVNGDPMKALADRYFIRREPPAWFRPSRERLDFLIKLAKEFKVDGVIWYQLMYREAYDLESYYFPDMLKKETGLRMLRIESDYDAAEIGPFRTRVETFIETIRR
jgi:benzoyl-CoA reductase/2-hydroxyglutaryl-CoA dehydratase subunit BcrC/BadD/HgdB